MSLKKITISICIVVLLIVLGFHFLNLNKTSEPQSIQPVPDSQISDTPPRKFAKPTKKTNKPKKTLSTIRPVLEQPKKTNVFAAHVQAPRTAKLNETVTLDASASTGKDLKYGWEIYWPNGKKQYLSNNTQLTSLTLTSTGYVRGTVLVVDHLNCVKGASFTINVSE